MKLKACKFREPVRFGGRLVNEVVPTKPEVTADLDLRGQTVAVFREGRDGDTTEIRLTPWANVVDAEPDMEAKAVGWLDALMGKAAKEK